MIVQRVTLPIESGDIPSSFDNVEDGGGETLFVPPLLFFFLLFMVVTIYKMMNEKF